MRLGLILKFLLLLLGISILIFLWSALPIISGYGAKIAASGVFVAGRGAEDVIREDLGNFPVRLASVKVNLADSSVTASVWGLAERKAIYRRGLGVTLVSGLPEEEIRAQRMVLAEVPVVNQDTVDWPLGDGGSDSLVRSVEDVVDSAFEGDFGTRAIIVVYKGRIVAERYARGFDRHTRLLGWSMTKGILNAMVGILVKQGRLDIRQPASVDVWKGDDRARITTADLLQMNSGLSWWEWYAGPGDATNMLFESADMGEYASRSALRHQPGMVFNYSSGTANIVSSIVRSKLPDSVYYRWPYEQLFYKLGMYSMVLEPDAGGTFVGSSYAYGTARDWSRFGLLYLRNGEGVLPESWVRYTRTGSGYGALWWNNDQQRRYRGVPEDCFSCEGYEGQDIWVIPSKELVVVRLALEHGQRLKRGAFLQGIIGALR
ncbi:MAG: serine hydrolase [Bacteroidetes bacterium]|nr:serine hydrolase [Bacteroidota bacterium]